MVDDWRPRATLWLAFWSVWALLMITTSGNPAVTICIIAGFALGHIHGRMHNGK